MLNVMFNLAWGVLVDERNQNQLGTHTRDCCLALAGGAA